MSDEFSFDTFEQTQKEFDSDVIQTPGISTFCSGSDWLLAAHQTLHQARRPIISRDGHNWLILSLGPINPFLDAFQPLEFSWGFGCPLIGSLTQESIDFLLDTLNHRRKQWQLTILSGIPIRTPFGKALTQSLACRYHVDTLEGTHCMQAEIGKGASDFFDRRSSRFRSTLRRAERIANEHGIVCESISDDIDPESLLERCFQIEKQSWKYKKGKSIFMIPRYKSFYTELSKRLIKKGTLRILFAQKNRKDVAYIMGGILGHVYRGFQMSYAQEYSHLSLGHFMQWEMIQRLAAEGIEVYDLGMVMDYKRYWSDRVLEITNIAIFKG